MSGSGVRLWPERWVALALAALSVADCSGRRTRDAASAGVPESRESCEERKRKLVELVLALPGTSVASATRTDLPAATIGNSPGSGPVVELSPRDLAIDGRPVAASDSSGRVRLFKEWLAAWQPSPRGARAAGAPPTLYFAPSVDVDVRTLRAFLSEVPPRVELRLLVRVAAPVGPEDPETTRASALTARVLTEQDPEKRRRVAVEAYQEFSECDALTAAVSSVDAAPTRDRWPRLKRALAQALPSCGCNDLDTTSLRMLVSAEQRAGVGALAFLPLSFLRDERCDASMPLRSIEKLVRQLEEFDAEYSAKFQRDAVAFDTVLENERLRVYFCDALPGETLAARERAHGTVHLHVPGTHTCEAWTFEPLSAGAPMGTILRAAGPSRPPLAFHYWQAAEEIRLFGPIDPGAPTKPTDEREWACEETLRLTGVDETAIRLGPLAWFFGEGPCLQAEGASVGFSGCVAARASGGAPVDTH